MRQTRSAGRRGLAYAATVHVQVGPLPSSSVTMWVAYARTVLAKSLTDPEAFGFKLGPDVLELFEGYLDEWEAAASASPDFRWEVDIDAEHVEFVMHSFQKVASSLEVAATRRGYPLSPPEGDVFYHALVDAVIESMTSEGRSRLEYAEHLRDTWPGATEE